MPPWRPPSAAESDDGQPAGGDPRRPLVVAGVILAAALAAGALAWWRFGDRVRWGEDQLLHPGDVVVEGLAPWIRADVRAEALRMASLDHGVPVDDARLPTLLARAFDMHPWIREVSRVEVSHPPAAVVTVVCREPVAMVRIPGGLLAIDADGVFLPSADFTAESAAAYPRVTGVATSPQGPEGSRWGDPAVDEAAALVSAVGPQWQALELVECRPAPGPRGRWDLVDRQGGVIRFGSAPGREQPGEPSAALKIARLKAGVTPGTAAEPLDLGALRAAGS